MQDTDNILIGTNLMQDISKIIKAGMQQKGISQQKLADLLNLSQGTISNILRNPNTLSIILFIRIAKVLEIEKALKEKMFNFDENDEKHGPVNCNCRTEKDEIEARERQLAEAKKWYVTKYNKNIIPAQNFCGRIREEEIHLYKSVLKFYTYLKPCNVTLPKKGEYFTFAFNSDRILIKEKPDSFLYYCFPCLDIVETEKTITILYEEWERYWEKNS